MNVEEFRNIIKFELLHPFDGSVWMHKAYINVKLEGGTYKNVYLYAVGKTTEILPEASALPKFEQCTIKESMDALIQMFEHIKEEGAWSSGGFVGIASEPVNIRPLDYKKVF